MCTGLRQYIDLILSEAQSYFISLMSLCIYDEKGNMLPSFFFSFNFSLNCVWRTAAASKLSPQSKQTLLLKSLMMAYLFQSWCVISLALK